MTLLNGQRNRDPGVNVPNRISDKTREDLVLKIQGLRLYLSDRVLA